jgi:hypothetical protein
VPECISGYIESGGDEATSKLEVVYKGFVRSEGLGFLEYLLLELGFFLLLEVLGDFQKILSNLLENYWHLRKFRGISDRFI